MANPSASFNRDYLFSPGVVFVVNQQKYDARYILTSLSFARNLFNYDTEVSAVELKLKPGADVTAVQRKIARILGDEFVVLDRYEQQADVFRIMEIEKFISYLFLTFILAIACFNVIGSLSMLILDKREDVETLRNLGADDRLIARIFLFEGRLISLFGALSGIVLGLLLCYIQQRFGTLGQKYVCKQAEGRDSEHPAGTLQIGIQLAEGLIEHQVGRCEEMDDAGEDQDSHGLIKRSPLEGQHIGKAQHQAGNRQRQGGKQMDRSCKAAPVSCRGIRRKGCDHCPAQRGACGEQQGVL